MTDSEVEPTSETGCEDDSSSFHNLILVPTAHTSEVSSEKVRRTINDIEPDMVAVELDKPRFQKLIHDAQTSSASVMDVVKRNVSFRAWLVAKLLSNVQSTVAQKLGISASGIDMKAAVETADNNNTAVALIDRDIRETINRFSSELSIREFLRTIKVFSIGYIQVKRLSKEELEETVELDDGQLSGKDINEILDELDYYLPTFKRVFVDERDELMAGALQELSEDNQTVVAVIGAAHEPGIRAQLTGIEPIGPDEYAQQNQDNSPDNSK